MSESETWYSLIEEGKHMLWMNFESKQVKIAYRLKIQELNAWIGIS